MDVAISGVVIFVIEGCFELKANGQLYRVEPGQLLWIPEGTELAMRCSATWCIRATGNSGTVWPDPRSSGAMGVCFSVEPVRVMRVLPVEITPCSA